MAQQQHVVSTIGPQGFEALLLTEQAAELLQVSRSFLEQDRTTHRHGVPFVRVGRGDPLPAIRPAGMA